MKSRFSRRALLAGVGGLSSIAFLGFKFCSGKVGGIFWSSKNKKMSEQNWATIGVLINHILPKTDTSPSAIEAGVVNYLHKTLSGDVRGWKTSVKSVERGKAISVSPGYSHLIGHYIKTADRLDSLSQANFKKEFLSLSRTEQESIVLAFSNGSKADVGYNVKGTPGVDEADDKTLFEMVRRHALEGCFADPSNGGNTNYIAWESIRHTCHMNYPKDQSHCPVHEM